MFAVDYSEVYTNSFVMLGPDALNAWNSLAPQVFTYFIVPVAVHAGEFHKGTKGFSE